MTIYIDADAGPVKQEVYRAAARHARMFCGRRPHGVMAGLVPAIHDFLPCADEKA